MIHLMRDSISGNVIWRATKVIMDTTRFLINPGSNTQLSILHPMHCYCHLDRQCSLLLLQVRRHRLTSQLKSAPSGTARSSTFSAVRDSITCYLQRAQYTVSCWSRYTQSVILCMFQCVLGTYLRRYGIFTFAQYRRLGQVVRPAWRETTVYKPLPVGRHMLHPSTTPACI